jgi:hypothetical protein
MMRRQYLFTRRTYVSRLFWCVSMCMPRTQSNNSNGGVTLITFRGSIENSSNTCSRSLVISMKSPTRMRQLQLVNSEKKNQYVFGFY